MLAYLDRRGLNGEALQQFEIGFALNDRAGLKSALMGAEYLEQQLVDTGLIIKPDDGGTSYDRFRGRIMFPIRDARGRCVAFGGRAMDPNARAKYLNSPETILFDRGAACIITGPHARPWDGSAPYRCRRIHGRDRIGARWI